MFAPLMGIVTPSTERERTSGGAIVALLGFQSMNAAVF